MYLFATLLTTLAFRLSFGVTITVDNTTGLIVHETSVYVYLSVVLQASGHNVLRFAQKVPSKSLCQKQTMLYEPIPATNENK